MACAIRLLIVFIFLAVLGQGLGDLSAAETAAESAADAQAMKLTGEFLEAHCAAMPLDAVALGKHNQDGRFVVPDRAALNEKTSRLKRFDEALANAANEKLSIGPARDVRLLRYAIGIQTWEHATQRDAWRNPMFYAKAMDVSVYLKRDFKPLDLRVQDMTAILRQAPELFAAARSNLDAVLPKVFVETAISMAEGSAEFLKKDVAKETEKVKDRAIQREFNRVNETAIAAIGDYVAWLKAERLPKADGGFALGRDGYRKMLQAELIDFTPEGVLVLGMAELRNEQARFAKAAAEIDPSSKPTEVYKAIQREHPTAESLVPDTRKNLEVIRQFVVDRKIATMPSEVRVRVAETLPPFRATSFASMDTPGPFETKATEAYYYVTPVEPEWSKEQAEEWLSAFNYYTTDVVSIHEAYPGHYLQFLALNASNASDVAKVFNSYAFVEGWAHYCEQMVIDEGFAQPGTNASREEQLRGAKYRVAQSGEALLRLCRLCCSVRLHTQGMTVDDATKFFMDNCYYEEKPARQEATRGTFDPGYLYYTLGKLSILKLRDDWRAQEGTRYSLQRFHDELLRHGGPPIRVLREIMLKDEKQWPQILPVPR